MQEIWKEDSGIIAKYNLRKEANYQLKLIKIALI